MERVISFIAMLFIYASAYLIYLSDAGILFDVFYLFLMVLFSHLFFKYKKFYFKYRVKADGSN